MRPANILVLGCLLALLAFPSCDRDKIEPEPTNVFIAGWAETPHEPSWWKDNQFQQKANAMDAIVTSAFVTPKGDVYHGGYVEDTPPRALYWKNGVVNWLPSAKGGVVSGITVINDVVYCSGTSDSKAVYWQDGVINYLFTRTTNTSTYGIYAYGKDIHIVGRDGRPVIWSWERNILGVIDDNLDGNTVFAIGNDVYVGGLQSDTRLPAYWIQGKTNVCRLTSGYTSAEVRAIYVRGSSVYLAGAQSNGTRTVATYWINGEPTIIDGGSNSSIHSIFVTPANSVLAAGVVYNDPLRTSAAFWRDGKLTQLAGARQSVSDLADPLFIIGY